MITRNEIEALIEKLADKTLSFGCCIKFREDTCTYGMIKFEAGDVVRYAGFTNKYGTWIAPLENQSPSFEPFQVKERIEKFKILGHDIYLGDVLAKMDLRMKHDAETVGGDELRDFWGEAWRQVVVYWKRCGFSKSLQQIFNDSGWEEVEEIKTNHARATYRPIIRVKVERLRSKEAQSLGEFLMTIFKV